MAIVLRVMHAGGPSAPARNVYGEESAELCPWAQDLAILARSHVCPLFAQIDVAYGDDTTIINKMIVFAWLQYMFFFL